MSAEPFKWPHEMMWPPGATEMRRMRHEQHEGPQRHKPLDWPALAGREPPERRWAIRGWLGFGHVTLMVGSGGIGKTLLAQQIASCLAIGKSFIGEVSEPYRCLMWACEDDHDELWRRQVALARWCNVGLEEFHERLVIEPRLGLNNALVSTEFGKLAYSPLITDLTKQADDMRAEVVVLDNVAQLYGASENDRHAVTAFMNALSGALPGRALLVLAHPARSSGSEFSGSSAWENVARTRLYLGATLPGERMDQDAEPPNNIRYLSRRKANYSEKDWRRMSYADGALTPDETEASGGVVGQIRSRACEGVVVDGLKRLQEMNIWPTEAHTSSRYLPRLMLDHRLGEGRSRNELADAMRRLLGTGKLKIEDVTRYSNSRHRMRGLKLSA